MTLHIQNTYPYTVTERDIRRFERKYKLRLPEPYRTFLLDTNGGRPDKDEFPTPWDAINHYIIVHYFYGLNYRRDTWGDLEYQRKTFTDRIPDELLAIAGDPGGNQICLGIAGERQGHIFIWEMEFEAAAHVPFPWEYDPAEHPPTYDNVSFVVNHDDPSLGMLHRLGHNSRIVMHHPHP